MNFTRFDEFGNPLDGSDSDSNLDRRTDDADGPTPERREFETILPEDKRFYPLASAVYPSHTKVRYEFEDRQDFREPIIKPAERRVIAQDLKSDLETIYDRVFMQGLFQHPDSIRNLAFVGALAHEKTEIVDYLVRETHPGITEDIITKKAITNQVVGEGRRFDSLHWTDRLFLEKRRQMSVSTEVMSLVAEDLNHKSWALNLIDIPGHPDFLD
jgi:U5 small nuclear ribonucleoprotein component